jgi:large subunit ribosomal protein L24
MRVKIRKGDTVEVISGRLEDKGKRGEVINVLLEDRRVVVQGVNIRTKHQKQVQTQAGRNINPGRIQFEGPIDISNVMLVCPKCGEPTRICGSTRRGWGPPRLQKLSGSY